MSAERRRFTYALLLSLLIHAFLASLIFGDNGLWVPGFGFRWPERWNAASDLRVDVIAEPIAVSEPAVPPVVEPLQRAAPEQPAESKPPPVVPSVPAPRRAAAASAPKADRSPAPDTGPDAAIGATPPPTPSPAPTDEPGGAAPAPAATEPADTSTASTAAPPVIALEQTDEDTWLVAPPSDVPSAGTAPVPGDAPDTAPPSEPEAPDVTRAGAEAARAEAERAEAERAEAARAEAARAEAARADDARAEAARAEAARAEAARAEAARAEAARAEAARAEAARAEAARAEAARADDARREAARRAIGRQLDEEADRRAAATRQLPSWSSARRFRLFGRTDPNAELIRWAEAWSRKIELNMTFDMVREPAKQPHTDPLVTVAVRSDGSVESITFVQSSGVAAIDEAIRRIVESQTPYQAFPPALAREFDVIEIRRAWHFDMAIRLY